MKESLVKDLSGDEYTQKWAFAVEVNEVKSGTFSLSVKDQSILKKGLLNIHKRLICKGESG